MMMVIPTSAVTMMMIMMTRTIKEATQAIAVKKVCRFFFVVLLNRASGECAGGVIGAKVCFLLECYEL